MRASLILISGIIVLSLAVARALSCVCSPLECDVLTEEDCPGGLTWDPCRCCKVCARVEGEPCGGLFGFSGSCAVGLQCVIKNLCPPEVLDEGTCSKIPGRWRRHCPHGRKMSGAGCNLIGEGTSSESGKRENNGKCVCGPSVPWCPDEAHPYTFKTRHECKLNLAAKTAYDNLISASDSYSMEGVRGIICPEDSIVTENGECKCISACPPNKCTQGERPVQVRAASPDVPGSCCPIYNCIPLETVSWDDTDDSELPKDCVDHNGVPRAIGDRWDQNPCVNCTCEESNGKGSVSCHATMCKSCEHAVPVMPGECCPRCHDGTNDTSAITTSDATTTTTVPLVVPISNCQSLEDCELPCHLGAENDDGCPICQCPSVTQSTTGLDPTDKICPELPHCGLNCELVKDQGGCPVCACEDSIESDVSVIPQNVPLPNEEEDDSSIVCPELKCDLHCDRGLIMDENDCTVCQCKPHATGCPIISACKKKCPYGYKLNRRGCLLPRTSRTCHSVK
ncbi:cysteine-rich motor neuron 1 protein isoform X2 [Diachasmimorpha longicaudata]|uniref:cysteine-rich motor neuron 1 protein isoform X2 n=1 Tax=Diachasmimorpha longicaudata TaxID=58733 RepID=UPI0030B8862C